MSLEVRQVDPAADQWLQNRMSRWRTKNVEAPILEITDAGREAESEQGAYGKNVIGCSGRIVFAQVAEARLCG